MKIPMRMTLFTVNLGLLMAGIFMLGGAGLPEVTLAAPQVCVPGPHSGIITGTQQWCAADSPHLLTADVTVPAGVTLTVEANVTVQAANYVELLVEGHLAAPGTPTQPITFTSSTDSGPGQWAGMAFDGGTGHISYATVRYAGHRNYVTDAAFGAWARSNIAISNVLSGEVRLENVTISDITSTNQDMGIYVGNSNLVVTDSLFTGIGNGSVYVFPDTPLYIAGGDSEVTLSNNTFTANDTNTIVLQAGAMMNHDTTLTQQNGLDGYVLEQDFTVPPTVTLTLEPGVTFMSGHVHGEFVIEGHLEALGTPAEPITFTSLADSAPGQWTGLVFDGGTGHLRHATVRYAGQRNYVTDAAFGAWARSNIAISNVLSGEVRLENVTISDISMGPAEQEMGVYVGNSNLVVTDSLFTGIGNGSVYVFPDTPLYIAGGDSEVTLSNNTFTANDTNTIVLQAGAMMNHDTTLTQQNGLDGYVLEQDFTVPPTVTLTLEPGVTFMSGHVHGEFVIEGHLEALGTPAEPITFTSLADSAPGQWTGLVFDGGTGHLRHATVRYAGQRNYVTDAAFGHWARSNIAISNVLTGEVRLENVTISDITSTNQDMGIYVGNSNLVVTDSLFTGIGNGSYYVFPDTPLYIAGGDSDVSLINNTFTANDFNNVVLQAGAMMNHDTTLTQQNGLDGYVLEQDFTVPPTVTLTVEPGVTVKGGLESNRAELRVEGHLDAIGTPTQPITFTSFYDNAPAQWPGLVFEGSAGAGTGLLRHATVRYGGIGNSVLDSSGDYHSGSNITVSNVLTGEVRLEHVTIEEEYHWDGWHHYGDHGLYVNDGIASIASSIIEDNCDSGNDDSGIYVAGDSRVLIDDSVIQANIAPGIVVEGDVAFVRVMSSNVAGNAGDGVRNIGDATVILSGDPDEGNVIAYNQDYGANQTSLTGLIIATNNYWGDPSGPTHPGNPAGTGEPVTDRVLYDPWLTEVPSGAPPNDGLVLAFGPSVVSAGESVNFGFLVPNLLPNTLENAVVVAQLPEEAKHGFSWPRGEYWADRHQVVWKLGDVAPGEEVHLGVQVHYVWGIDPHQITYLTGLIVAENLPNDLLDLDEYLNYEEVTITSFDELSEQELQDILDVEPEVNALFIDSETQGFAYYGAARLEQLSDGTEQLSLPMIDRAKSGEQIFIHQVVSQPFRFHNLPASVIGDISDASFALDYQTKWVDILDPFLDPPALLVPTGEARCTELTCGQFSFFDCLRNCLIDNVPARQFSPSYSEACFECYQHGGAACSTCAAHMETQRNDSLKYSTQWCQDICTLDPNNGQCDPDQETRECKTSHVVMVTPCGDDCKFRPQDMYYESCHAGERCIAGVCEPIDYPDTIPIEVLVGGDPNAMYGPMEVTPNQTISYAISYENVGEGTAYGVHVESRLPEVFDPDTLLIHNDGVYFPSTRALVWQVGELASQAGGMASFEVQVPSDAISGTIIIANATVYFPSVPETTPTNDVVTIVGDVVGHTQLVETVEGTPVAITLSGHSPTGNPLTYDVERQPLNGELSGAPPNLTYTPADNFEGQDSLSFRVDDGVNTSLPAEVSILVTTGVETIPPEVYATSPISGAMDVLVFVRPLYDNIYQPTIQAWFTEPINETTVNTATLTIHDSQGNQLNADVAYDATSNRSSLLLHERLTWRQMYTATMTTGVHDTSGNPLAAPYAWAFTTRAPCFDLDGDGGMDIVDIMAVAGHWNMDAVLFPQYDLNGDDAIDVLDIGLVAQEWGELCP
ncbi:MAG: Ig-like domain-containing protein [Chloroflexota bacterium]|nr:Ig-like domain-containing protein [Chloroflexota bacterium]